MSTHISRTVSWNNDDVYKYKISLDADISIVSVSGTTATVNVNGNYTVYQTEHEQQMVSTSASDYGFLFYGEVLPAAPTTVIPGDHYMEALPTLFGGSAEQYMSKMLLEFRGDTYASDGGNFTSLWTVHDGLVINRKFGNTSTVVPLNETFQVDISEGGAAAVLSWSATYVTFGPKTYHWGETITWVSIADLDYRPGAALDTNTSIWKSHNRIDGACHVLSSISPLTWQECRTHGGEISAQGNPPLILHAANANSWYNQKRLGKMS